MLDITVLILHSHRVHSVLNQTGWVQNAQKSLNQCRTTLQMVYIIRVFFYTKLEIDGKPRTVDDFQPRNNAKDFFEQGKLSTEDEFEHFCKPFTCEKELSKKYVEHLKINKKKRADVRNIQLKDQEKNV